MTSLAERRAQLVALCGQQRGDLAQEIAHLPHHLCDSFSFPFSLNSVGERLVANRKLILTVAGVALGMLAARPKRLLALAGRSLRIVQTVRKALPLLSR